MTKFDEMEQNFVALTEEELMETEGGFVITLTTGAIIGIGLAVAGGAAGYYFGSR
jgi:lactobin A/cerein 7B family class IIb bacteriocin